MTYCNTLICMELLDLIMEDPINERMDEGVSFRCTLGMKKYIKEVATKENLKFCEAGRLIVRRAMVLDGVKE